MHVCDWKAAALLVFAATMPCDFGAESASPPNPVRDAVADLRRDINLYNLVNGLQLSRQQTATILELARQADAARSEAEEKAQGALKSARQAFADLRTAVASNQGIPKDVEARANRFDQQLKDLRERAEEQTKALEEKLLATLSDGQKLVLANYKHCLIPTPDLKDPTRVGQASGTDRATAVLRMLRQIPKPVYDRDREQIFARHMELISKHLGKRTPEEEAAFKQKFLAVIDEARALSDVDFEVQKERLADALKPKDKIADAVKAMEAVGASLGKPGKAAQILLAPGAAGVLAERLALLSAPDGRAQTDLNKIQPADSCQDGKCALDGPGNLAPDRKPGKKEGR